MYYEYWGLQKPPFDNVPDPSMYVDSHLSMENAIAETLFGIEEGNECIAVIVGDVGLGKTLSLRMIIDSLDPDKYKIALITNPAMSFIQLLREIIGQLSGKHWAGKREIDLLESFNRILFDTQDEGKRVLIFIDEANAIAPANLESLRLLTNMQLDQGNLFTMILAGQIELAHRLEHPKRANLFQRVGTYSMINKIESPDLLQAYVESRLRLAGGAKQIFTDDAISALWEHSDYGVPRLINKIAKLSLKAAETNELSEINGDVVNQIGERFKKLTRPAAAQRRPRKKIEEKVVQEITPEPVVDEKSISEENVEDEPPTAVMPEVVTDQEMPAVTTGDEMVGHDTAIYEADLSEVIEEKDVAVKRDYQEVQEKEGPATVHAESPSGAVIETEIFIEKGEDDVVGLDREFSDLVAFSVEETEKTLAAPIHEERVDDTKSAPPDAEIKEKETSWAERGPDREIQEEITVGQHSVEIVIPVRLVGQARTYDKEKRIKMAGVLAAQILQKNPHLLASHLDDPVHIWGDIRKYVLNKLE